MSKSSFKVTLGKSTAPAEPHRAELPPQPVPRERILWLLVSGHVLLGLTIAVAARLRAELSIPFSLFEEGAYAGILFSQTNLLGIWGVLASNRGWQRLIGIIVGISYLFIVAGFAIEELSVRLFIVIASAVAFVAMPLLILRFFTVVIRAYLATGGTAGRFQFSLKHLIVVTIMIAYLVAIGKEMWSQLPDRAFASETLAFAALCGTVGVLSVWPVLDLKHPTVYGIISMAAVGASYTIGLMYYYPLPGIYLNLVATEAALILLTLCAVRLSGYRLVRLGSLAANERGR